MADVTRRMLALLALLQTGRTFSGEELARRLEVSPRTLRRDVERLREYGYPVHTRPGPGGFYRLAAGTSLPPLLLDDDEAVATLVGLAMVSAMAGAATDPASPWGEKAAGAEQGPAQPDTDGAPSGGISAAADRAFGKIDQILPRRLRPHVQSVRASVETAPMLAPPVAATTLATIGEACARHELISFGYTGRDQVHSIRRVEPYRQVHLRLRWYLLAWDTDRGDWRTFRLDRVSDVTLTGTRFTPRPLPAATATAYLRNALSQGRHRAVVTIDAPAAVVADRLRFADVVIEPRGEQRCEVTVWTDSFEWLVMQLGLLDVDFEIREPVEFARRCQLLAQRLRRAGRLARATDPTDNPWP